MPLVRKNKKRSDLGATYQYMDLFSDETTSENSSAQAPLKGGLETIEELREYDVPYYQRVAIDTGIRVAQWYSVRSVPPSASSGASSLAAVVRLERLQSPA